MSRQVEINTRLIKLHLQWPDRRRHLEAEEEALEFFKYLFLNFHMDQDVMALDNVEAVQAFLDKNRRLLKPRVTAGAPKIRNARIEPRIANDAQVFVSVSECDDLELVGVTSNGKVLDVGLHGLQISIDQKLPADSAVALTLTTESGDRYELQTLTRWQRHSEGVELLGLRILEAGGFSNWQADFGAKFVAPRLARKHTPKKARP